MSMTSQVSATPSRPIPRVAREMCDSTGFLLATLGLEFKGTALANAEAAGFEVYDYSVLALLAEGDRQTQATIADSLGLDPSRLVALLDSLEERGMVARQRDPNDRRRHVVSITDAGRLELSKIRAVATRTEDDFLAPLEPGERAVLHGMLLRLAGYHDPRCLFAPELGGEEAHPSSAASAG